LLLSSTFGGMISLGASLTEFTTLVHLERISL
jgi:hypothetical protein